MKDLNLMLIHYNSKEQLIYYKKLLMVIKKIQY